MRLYLGNLSENTTEANLADLLTPFGSAGAVMVIKEKSTGRSRGFAFVDFTNDEEARAAIKDLNGKEVGGQALTVNEARKKHSEGAR